MNSSRRQAFTLIEVIICISLLAILIFPIMTMAETIVHAYDKSQRQVALRSNLDRVEAKIKRSLRGNSKYQITADNRGARWANGSTLEWKDGVIRQGQTVLADNVKSFSLYKRDGITFADLSLQDPVMKLAEQKQFMIEEAGYASRI
ncbi:MAG: prepilin-type N-terminal cleavage/methylation domain-containing protein [Candidatus Eremiobacteraeota bacterium]|nr:prepilin-type N-terminal cleavage/methylation domain-containing protein [Candidatus Eremiobacteraeota bacterium]